MSILTNFARCALIASGVLVALGPTRAQSGTPVYTMGPEDKLKVRVVDWRTGTYDTHEWPALTGEFIVGASGTVSLPIVGDLVANGKTPTELAAAIAVSLRDKVGLARDPYASVEVLQYRPFYILGSVGKAGEYPFRPGLTVLQAVGVGGGFERTQDASLFSLERDILSSRGEIRVLDVERQQNMMRQARITAELQDLQSVRWPDELASQIDDPGVAKAIKDEEALLAAHGESLRTQLKSISQNKELLAKELSSLAAKSDVLSTQEALSRQELTVVAGLVARGLAGTPRQIALQQNEAQLKSSRLDLDLTALKTNQDIVRLDRDGVELLSKNRAALLSEKAELRTRLASIAERIGNLRSLISQAEARAPSLATGVEAARLVTTYTLTRFVNGEIFRRTVAETEFIEPGDTLVVDQHRDNIGAVASSAR